MGSHRGGAEALAKHASSRQKGKARQGKASIAGPLLFLLASERAAGCETWCRGKSKGQIFCLLVLNMFACIKLARGPKGGDPSSRAVASR